MIDVGELVQLSLTIPLTTLVGMEIRLQAPHLITLDLIGINNVTQIQILQMFLEISKYSSSTGSYYRQCVFKTALGKRARADFLGGSISFRQCSPTN